MTVHGFFKTTTTHKIKLFELWWSNDIKWSVYSTQMNNSLNKVSAHKLNIILFLLHQYLSVVLDDKLLHWSIVGAVCKTMQSAPIALRKLHQLMWEKVNKMPCMLYQGVGSMLFACKCWECNSPVGDTGRLNKLIRKARPSAGQSLDQVEAI